MGGDSVTNVSVKEPHFHSMNGNLRESYTIWTAKICPFQGQPEQVIIQCRCGHEEGDWVLWGTLVTLFVLLTVCWEMSPQLQITSVPCIVFWNCYWACRWMWYHGWMRRWCTIPWNRTCIWYCKPNTEEPLIHGKSLDSEVKKMHPGILLLYRVAVWVLVKNSHGENFCRYACSSCWGKKPGMLPCTESSCCSSFGQVNSETIKPFFSGALHSMQREWVWTCFDGVQKVSLIWKRPTLRPTPSMPVNPRGRRQQHIPNPFIRLLITPSCHMLLQEAFTHSIRRQAQAASE